MKAHLSRDSRQEFAFISAIPARTLADICDSARNSNDNPKDFYRYQIQNIGQKRRKVFEDFCTALELDPKKDEELSVVFDFLKRADFLLEPDSRDAWFDILTWTDLLLTGISKTTISVLLTYAESEER